MVSKDKLANLLSFAYIAFMGLFLAAQLVRLFMDAQSGALAFYASNNHFFISDFVHFYVMAKMALSTQAHQAYNLDVQQQVFYQVVHPPKVDERFCTQYMPFLYPLVIPLVLFPVHMAHFVWSSASLALGFVGLVVLLKSLDVRNAKTIAAILFAGGASMPSIITLYFGQISWFLAAFVALYITFWLQKRDYLAGIFLAFTTVKPQYSFMLAIPALAEKRYKLIAAAFACELFLLFLAGITIGFHDVVLYPAILLSLETKFPIAAEKMVSLRGLLSAILPQSVAVPVSLIIMLAAAAALFVFCLRVKNQTPALKRWTMACAILLSLVVSPHTFIYDCVLLVCVAALTLVPGKDSGIDPSLFSYWRRILLAYPLFGWAIFLLAPGLWQNYCFAAVNIVLAALAVQCLCCLYHTEEKSMSGLMQPIKD
jgi:hypothetical protein